MAAGAEAQSLPDPDKVQAGILAILIAERDERLDPEAVPRKTEVILGGLGMTAREIALLTGKSQAAVAKAIQRARS